MRLASLAKWTGIGAATVWLSLAIAVALGGVIHWGGTTFINGAVAAILAGASALLGARVRAVAAANAISPGHPAMRRLMRIEALTMAIALLVGIALFSAAIYRLVGEGMAVFG